MLVLVTGRKGSHIQFISPRKTYSGLENQRRYWGRWSKEERYWGGGAVLGGGGGGSTEWRYGGGEELITGLLGQLEELII